MCLCIPYRFTWRSNYKESISPHRKKERRTFALRKRFFSLFYRFIFNVVMCDFNYNFLLSKIFILNFSSNYAILNTRKAPTPKVDAPNGLMSLRTPPILWARQDRHFYFFLLFLLSWKVSNAISKLPKYISKANVSMKIERIS